MVKFTGTIHTPMLLYAGAHGHGKTSKHKALRPNRDHRRKLAQASAWSHATHQAPVASIGSLEHGTVQSLPPMPALRRVAVFRRTQKVCARAHWTAIVTGGLVWPAMVSNTG